MKKLFLRIVLKIYFLKLFLKSLPTKNKRNNTTLFNNWVQMHNKLTTLPSQYFPSLLLWLQKPEPSPWQACLSPQDDPHNTASAPSVWAYIINNKFSALLWYVITNANSILRVIGKKTIMEITQTLCSGY